MGLKIDGEVGVRCSRWDPPQEQLLCCSPSVLLMSILGGSRCRSLPYWKAQMEFWALALALPSPGFCGHLGRCRRGQQIKDLSICLCVSLCFSISENLEILKAPKTWKQWWYKTSIIYCILPLTSPPLTELCIEREFQHTTHSRHTELSCLQGQGCAAMGEAAAHDTGIPEQSTGLGPSCSTQNPAPQQHVWEGC